MNQRAPLGSPTRAATLATSALWLDIVLWGAVAVILQIVTFLVATMVLPGLRHLIEAGSDFFVMPSLFRGAAEAVVKKLKFAGAVAGGLEQGVGYTGSAHALLMLASVLDGNDAARFPRTLVRSERLANSAGASYDGIGRGPAMFYLDGVPSDGKTVAQLEEALRREVRRVADEGVSDDELKRIRAQVIAAHVYQRDSMFFQARQMGSMETSGLSYKTPDIMLEKLKQVTPAQVQDVARKYFGDDQLTIAYLDPQPLEGRKAFAPPPGARHAR